MTEKEKRAEYQRKWREQNPDKSRAWVREWRIKYPERAKQSDKEKYEKNKEKYAEQHHAYYLAHKKEIRASQNKYYAEHKEKIKFIARKGALTRRARKRKTVVNISLSQVKIILSRGCFLCGSFEYLTLAHDIPIANGGNTTLGNVFCLCKSCNSKMGTQPLSKIIKQISLPI